MQFVTVYESFSPNRIHILRGILEQYGIRCRVLKAPVDKVVPKGMRLQVEETKEAFAYQIIRENGFVINKLHLSDNSAPGRFWIYLFIALLLTAATAIIVALIF